MRKNVLNRIFICCMSIILFFSLTACDNEKKTLYGNDSQSASITEIENDSISESQTQTSKTDSTLAEGSISIPNKEQVLNMRASATAGMSEEEIERITENIKIANLTMENAYFYENLFEKLSDPEDLYWNYVDMTGEIQIGWVFEMEGYLEYDASLGLSYDEFAEEYGTPVVADNRFDADNFVLLMEEMRDSMKTDLLDKDFNILIQLMKSAKETHDVKFMKEIYYILHDMDYFLFRYGIEDVGMYTRDDSTVSTYYHSLQVYQ